MDKLKVMSPMEIEKTCKKTEKIIFSAQNSLYKQQFQSKKGIMKNFDNNSKYNLDYT